MTSAEDIIRRVVGSLDQAGFAFMLVGSFSSNFYGIPRSTQDVDLVVEVTPDRPITRLTSYLDEDIHLQPQQSFELFTATTKHELTVVDSAFRVELFHLSDDEYDQQRFTRRSQVELFGVPVWLPTAEDVIVTKLRWLRRKDEDDIRNILAVRIDQLDWEYMRSWCERHQTTHDLEKLIAEVKD